MQAPDWQLPEEAHHIGRGFRFRNFREALAFLPNIRELTRVEIPGSAYSDNHRTASKALSVTESVALPSTCIRLNALSAIACIGPLPRMKTL